ncbi:uncharacterized protein N7484_004133 [Penicillium longicatenatum]|uniref:uncharacterized protein n=1 Tax=Penicillium longicatenatum TaxID=1561947 RepID=UPI00254935EE|nr:uncharacterized protein N7484_004133 [Penicillium longicatenatum]KAJ5650410.1 hypothetical protein N7484_004133 [Penicillium longicatenatum]
MTEEPQLGSIQERIAALKQSQAAHPSGPEPPLFRPAAERGQPARPPPSYDESESAFDGDSTRNKPTDGRTQRPVVRPPPTPSPRPELKPKPKAPHPCQHERTARLLPLLQGALSSPRGAPLCRLEDRQKINQGGPRLNRSPPMPLTLQLRRPTTGTTGNGRIKAPAWGETELPVLPPRRIREDPIDVQPPPRSESKSDSRLNGLTSKLSSLRGKGASPSPPTRPSRPALPTRSSIRSEKSPAPPPLPVRRPSGLDVPSYGPDETNNPDQQGPPSLPTRRLPPPANTATLDNIRQSGFGGLKTPNLPVRPNSTPATNTSPNGVPPPIPLGSRPDLSKLQATKPKFHGSSPGAVQASNSTTECLVCRDFSGPDARGAQYPRASLPTQDLGWLANELTAPFPSPTDKARAIFSWMHHNIHYDTVAFFNDNVKPSTPQNTLATGLAVCEGYAGLYAVLATKAGLEAVVIGGASKGYGYTPLAPGARPPPFKTTHAWNAVKIDGGRWKLVDPCWGSGCVNGKGMPYEPKFNPSQFSMSNEEFGLKHYPENKDYLLREDGRFVSYEEYIVINPDMPTGLKPIKTYSDVDKHSIGRKTMQPESGEISVYSAQSPLRFQFGLICEHWTLARHSRLKPALFLLMIKGVDGRKDDQLVFRHVPGSGPGGGGEFWYVDVDPRMLGAPGQKVLLAVLTKFGERTDCRGITAEEYESQRGRVGMAWAFIAQWELVK